MGRRDLSRAVLILAAVAAAVASAAAAAVGVPWTVLERGTTMPNGAQQPTGYVAVTRTQETRFQRRLSAADRTALQRVNLQHTGVVAIFLDGMPCGRDITVNRVVRTSATVNVTLHWTRPPIGYATCVRTSTPYVVLGVARTALGHPVPTRVNVVAVART